jgi:predicted dehydrogenase
VGVCDPVRANAESLADQAAERFGSRHATVSDLDQLTVLGVEAVDVTTTPRSHHTVAVEALQRGWHAMVEKPLGLTIRACNMIQRASQTSGRVLATAENYRRDPVNRLAKALMWARHIYGSSGSMALPEDRSGGRIRLALDGRGAIDDDRILDLVPDFHLDPVTAALFGGDRLSTYSLPFAETDRKLLAVEYADFAAAILGEHPAEVDAEQGSRSVAVAYALLESGALGRPVTVADVLAEQVDGYQQPINESLGL